MSRGLRQRSSGSAAAAAAIAGLLTPCSSARGSGGRFVLVKPQSFAAVCFWYIPRSLRHLGIKDAADVQRMGPEDRARLHAAAPAVKGRMQQAGDAMIGFQPSGADLPNFFRLVFANPGRVSIHDVVAALERMDTAYGHDL